MVKHNNIIPNVHLRKHWQRRVRVHLDQPQKKLVRLQKRQAKSKQMYPRPVQKLRPVVSSATRKYAGKVRYGRGFTLAELKGAGLSARVAQSVGISVDHRRTSTSNEQLKLNIERLNSYKSALVLFPRKDGKPKKGLIADTSNIDESKIAANTGVTLARKADAAETKFEAITADMKKVNSHSIYRQAWTNARYKGRRDKRKADEAAKEK